MIVQGELERADHEQPGGAAAHTEGACWRSAAGSGINIFSLLSNILPSHSQPKLSFTLNPDTGLPDGFRLHEHRASNKMIEEFMLLANMAVARRIYTAFPEAAVLRRHPHPKMDMLDKIVEQLGFLGVEIEGE